MKERTQMTKTKNSAIEQHFAANPVLIESSQIGVIEASFSAFETEAGQKLLAGEADDSDFWTQGPESRAHPFRPYNVSGGILQIPVYGSLLNRFSYAFGRWATGYQYIEKAVTRGLQDSNVNGIALMIDSPGGEVSGLFELTSMIHGARSDKPIKAYAADSAYSAAYAIASAASEIIVTRGGGTGSVGVVTMHVSYEEALQKSGIAVTFTYAGKHKIEGNPYQALSDSAKERIQARVDKLYGEFTSTVAEYRGMSEDDVRATEAMTYDAEDSVATGFADRVGVLDEELANFSESAANRTEGNTMSKESNTPVTFTQAQLDEQVTSARAEGVKEGVKAEQDRREAILGSEAAKSRPVLAATLIAQNIDSATAAGILEGAPVEASTTEAPKGKADAGTGTPFDAHMSGSEQPNVGADTEGNTQMSQDDKDLAGIKAAVSTQRGPFKR
jgi:signal peptide peptidase SppA